MAKLHLPKFSVFEECKYLFIALYPILGIYKGISGLSIGTIILTLLVVVECVLKRRISFNRQLIILMSVFVGINFINLLFSDQLRYIEANVLINNTISMLFFAFITSYYCNNINIEKLYNSCKIILAINVLFLIIQLTNYYAFGYVISGKLVGLEVDQNVGRSTAEGLGRMFAFFPEPSHMAIFSLPLLAMSLLKKNYITVVLSILAILLSTSSLGLLGIAVIILTSKIWKRKTVTILVAFICLTTFLIMPDYLMQHFILDKINQININQDIRLAYYLSLIKYFDVKSYILGIGINQISNYFSYLGIDVYNYSNAFLYCFFSFGLIGLAAIVSFIIYVFYNTNKNYYQLIYILLIVLATDQVLFNRNLSYILFYILPIAKKREG